MTAPAGPTAYDLVAYPSSVFATTLPDHLATLARIHGLTPPPIETARVLEIGGGDGINLIAMAAAYPDARFLSFDLAAAPVARGQAIIAASGLTNVRVVVGDILDLAQTLEGTFDYVSAHGVYAWVPAPVRDALMALIGRVLSPDGVAFVSYNALPGGYFRRAVRDMLRHEIGHIADAQARLVAARAFLVEFARPRSDDRPVLAAMRDVARPISLKALNGLHHDELGEVFEPQAFGDVVANAAARGLRFLNESEPGCIHDGLPGKPLDEPEVVRAVQTSDQENVCFFHQTLFVRDTVTPARTPDLKAIRELYAAAQCERVDESNFRSAEGTFGISDAPLADAVGKLGAAWPGRIRVGDLVDDEMRLEAVFRLYEGKAIMLYVAPLPGTRTPGSHPQVSGFARALLAMGEETIYTLDQRALKLDQPGPRAFLTLLDGSRDRAAIEAGWAASGYGEETDFANALARFAAAPLMVA